nr:MAG TPA: hypothetical protein [Caudoviricetes sp.]DAV50878.1 MAG TPA: hypothetical protein [Caudoviricetes sp.]
MRTQGTCKSSDFVPGPFKGGVMVAKRRNCKNRHGN